jgi:hypothetical protein
MLVATVSIFALTIAAVSDQAKGESSLDIGAQEIRPA